MEPPKYNFLKGPAITAHHRATAPTGNWLTEADFWFGNVLQWKGKVPGFGMTKDEMKQYLSRWKTVNRDEKAIRQAELEALYLPDVIRMFAGAFEQAIRQVSPRSSSGLIDQQTLLHKTRNG